MRSPALNLVTLTPDLCHEIDAKNQRFIIAIYFYFNKS